MRVLVITPNPPPLASHLADLYKFLVERCQDGGNVTLREMMTYQGLKSPAPLLVRLERLVDRGLIVYS
jgi:hypothetical protein